MTVQTVFEYLPENKKKYKQQYPELLEIEEFANMSQPDIIFSWYMGYEYSPYNYPKKSEYRTKIALSISKSYGDHLSRIEKSKYIEGNFPEHIRRSIDRMAQLNTKARIEAKETVESIFSNFKKIAKFTIEDFCDDSGDIDLDKVSKYTKLSIELVNNMSSVIDKVEKGFSVTKIANGHLVDSYQEGKGGMNIADQLLNE